jgi:hypothetical protein
MDDRNWSSGRQGGWAVQLKWMTLIWEVELVLPAVSSDAAGNRPGTASAVYAPSGLQISFVFKLKIADKVHPCHN